MRTKRLMIIFGILLSLTLAVAISSAVFSIRRVDAYCYNIDDHEQLDRIVNGKYDRSKSVKELLYGKNIFSLDESELIEEVEGRESGIKVINIERLFPNRISINYIKLYEYFEVEYRSRFYLFCQDGKITGTLNEFDSSHILVKTKLNEEPVDGLANVADFEHLLEIIETVEKLGYIGTEASGIIEFIDFDKKPDYIYIKMRSGVYIEISNKKDLGEKVRSALSMYVSDASMRLKGTIIIGDENITYSPYNRYEEVN